MKKRIMPIILVIITLLLSLTTAYATPPSNPHIGSGTSADGGNYFQYYGSSGTWKDLKTPPHWVLETNEVAYCLEHKNDSPSGNETYSPFNPSAVYSSRIHDGLLAILKNGYPYYTGGLSAKQARYATANAIRAWLSENGIGYNFMTLSRGYIRAKSGQQSTYDFMVSLVNKARNNQQPNFSISANPSNVTLQVQGNKLVGTTQISYSGLNANYIIDVSKIPSGVTITGHTGNNGDVLTVTAPFVYAGQTVNMNSVFIGQDTRASVNMYWFKAPSDEQDVVVPVIDTIRPAAYGSLRFTSSALGWVEIIKTGEETGAKLQGAVFQILNSSNSVVDTLTTNANGYAKSIDLIAGTYKLKEITAPNGYILDTTVHGNIRVSADNTTTVNLTNEVPKGIIRITKTNGNSHMGNYSLEGAEFSITNASGDVIETVATDNQGKANSSELPLGRYSIREVTAPNGFMLNNTIFTAELTYQNQNISIVYGDITVAEQPQTGQIRLTKTNSNTSMGDYSLAGAEFEILNSNGNVAAILTTDGNGQATSSMLPLGEYTVIEKTAPYGYVVNDTEFTANLEYGGQTVSIVYDDVTVPNAPQTGKIKITKQDSETGTEPQGDATLNGAVFEIYNADGGLMERLECGNDNFTESAELPLGTYTVKEIEPPTGYLLNPTSYIVEIEYTDQTVEINRHSYVIVDDVIKGQISITKFADIALAEWETDNPKPPLAGVEFEIRLKSTGELADTLITDTDGKVISIELPYGIYTVTETKTVQGYKGCDPFDVVVSEDGKIYSYIVENEVYKAQVKIVKVDEDTGEVIPIAGTAFQIRDVNGELIVQHVNYPQEQDIDTFVTDDTGTLTLPEPLIYGEYTLHEITPPYGYWLNEEPLEELNHELSMDKKDEPAEIGEDEQQEKEAVGMER